jgi:hypothetical protein
MTIPKCAVGGEPPFHRWDGIAEVVAADLGVGKCTGAVVDAVAGLVLAGKPLWHTARPAPYSGRVFSIRVKRPRSTAQRRWNVVQGVLFPVVVVTPIVLELTGVISWSWWWVLSPVWIGGILLVLGVLGVCALLIGSRWYAHRQARSWMNQLGSEWLREFITGKADPGASGGDLRLGDGEGFPPNRSGG